MHGFGMETAATIQQLITEAIAPSSGILAMMASKSTLHQEDIPAAFEACALLSHTLSKFGALNTSQVTLAPGVYISKCLKRLTCVSQFQAGELEYAAMWLMGYTHSQKIKQQPGVLAIPFSIEVHEDLKLLIPEWFAVFYLRGDPAHCVPLLTLRSILEQPDITDWTQSALRLAEERGLPCAQAKDALAQYELSRNSKERFNG